VDTLITVEGLDYSIGVRSIFDNVSFTIADGDRVAIVGPNGSGKSTLIKMLLGAVKPDSGTIRLPLRVTDIGFMPQHLADLGELPNMSVTDFVLSGRNLDQLTRTMEGKLREMDRKDLSEREMVKLAHDYSEAFEEFMARGGLTAEDELLNILIGMGLSGLGLDQDVRATSGGQKTKLAFARVLFAKPRVMILDEPTNHLDEDTIQWAVNYLKDYDGTLIVVSHNPSLIDELVTRVIFLDSSGKLQSFRGGYSDFLQKKSELDEARRRLGQKQDRQEAELREFIDRWSGTSGKKVAQVRDREKKLARLKEQHVAEITRQAQITARFPVKIQPVSKILSLSDVTKSYGDNAVLKGISLELFRGDRVAISGPNGAGKSTLLKIVARVIESDTGNVTFGDRVETGYYAQEHETLQLTDSVLETMAHIPDINQQKARSILAHFLFQGDRVFTKVGSLSLGERSRLALATLVAAGYNFLVLDEPTNHLDILAREQVKAALSRYEGTILVISHDLDFLQGIGVDKVLLMPEHKFTRLGQIS
jgi:ATPase subunit of ABC transporter with duplicated ATPase domains